MTARGHISWLATTLLAASLIAACSGSDDDPAISPVTATPSTSSAAPDPDGLTPEQREVADVVTGWNEAAFSVDTDQLGPAIEPFVTSDVLQGVVSAEAQQDPGSYLGEVTIDVRGVTIGDGTATVDACQDGSQAYRVAKGETEAGVGDSTVGAAQLTVTLTKQDGRWLISRPQGEPVASC